MRRETRPIGASFGDRACLGLAEITGAVAMTTEQAWRRLAGGKVEVVR